MRTLLGLFRRNKRRVGQFDEPSGALGSNLSASRRLTLHATHELDCIINAVTAIADDTARTVSTDHQGFTKYKKSHEHYRNMTKVSFMYTYRAAFPACAFYVEHPESKQLLPIVRCVRDRRFNGTAVVWVVDAPHDPLVVPESTMMYASDEPAVAGKTLEQVRERYGED